MSEGYKRNENEKRKREKNPGGELGDVFWGSIHVPRSKVNIKI